VTRTWPNARRFSPAQRDLYEAVLGAQRTCVSLCRAGAGLSLDGLHAVAENALRGGLEALGFDLARGVSHFSPSLVGGRGGRKVMNKGVLMKSRGWRRCFRTTWATTLGSTCTTPPASGAECRCGAACASPSSRASFSLL
jgi:Metallopeptidase family M24